MNEHSEMSDEIHKKGRVRKKQLLNSILNQMHFYFSDANLSKDRFLAKLLQESEYVDLSTFLIFNKVRKLTNSVDDLVKALKKSEILELDETETKVKRKTPINIKLNEEDCTIYVQTIKSEATHEWLANVFSEFGKVDYVSIPKYSHNKINKGFAFVEFATPDGAKNALEYFASINCIISTHINAEELCSNKCEAMEHSNDVSESRNSKRKIEDVIPEDSDDSNKKAKVMSDKEEDEEKPNEKKKKKKTSKRKIQIKELGLQILSKADWRKLRNRYWDMQRKKMKQLKQHLNKKRFQNERLKQEPPNEVSMSEDSGARNKEEKPFVPGAIVKLIWGENIVEAKKLKNELKASNPEIQYIEVPVTLNSDTLYLRFANSKSARTFCNLNTKGTAEILEGEEENNYWSKINSSRNAKLSKEIKKQRGRDKLLKRAERELGKHIRFDDSE